MSRIKWKAGFLPGFKNDQEQKRPFDNRGIYPDYSKTIPKRVQINKDHEELKAHRWKSHRKRYYRNILRGILTIIGILLLFYVVFKAVIEELS